MFKNVIALTFIVIATVAATDCFPGLLRDIAEVCRFDAVRRIIG